MEPHPQLRLATLPGNVARAARDGQASDWFHAAAPEGVIPIGDVGGGSRAFLSRHATQSIPVLDPSTGQDPPEPVPIGDGTVSIASSGRSLARVLDTVTADVADGGSALPPVILTRALELSVDTTALSTTIRGIDALIESDFANESPETPTENQEGEGQPVVLSTGLPAGYRNTAAGCRLIGVGEADDPEATGSRVVEVRPNRVFVRPIDTDRLGLEVVYGVGPQRASTLVSAGFETRQQVADAPLATLRDLEGFGRETAQSVQQSATAMAEGQVERLSRTGLPAMDPLFIDIETDGLHPTVTWLIGVLDGGPSTGTYRSFVARDPDDPGDAIEAFIEWYRESGQQRTLVAYNGEDFDFPVLAEHLQAYRPELAPVFEATERFDPYAWAVDDGNAFLPGRTNRLEDVAAGLGHETESGGFTGAAVARTYRRWLQDPGPDTEPPWERIDAYCEDDVRALARVYEALESAESARATSTEASSAETTTQGTLSEW